MTKLRAPGVIHCARCGAPCQLAPVETDRPEIAILRGKSTAGRGVCPSCNATAFLQDPDIPTSFILGEMDPEKRTDVLRMPFMQAQFAEIVRAQHGGMGLDPAMIDWDRVARNWDLPHPSGTWKKRRPGMDHLRRRQGPAAPEAPLQRRLEETLPGATVEREAAGAIAISAPGFGRLMGLDKDPEEVN